jgi:alpha-glucosidase (family GH31 glycosyl hydrolase)
MCQGHTFRLTLTDPNDLDRWQVPTHLFQSDPTKPCHKEVEDDDKGLDPSMPSPHIDIQHSPFSVVIQTVNNNKTTVLDTRDMRLVYKKQYIEFSTLLDPAAHVYGAGERIMVAEGSSSHNTNTDAAATAAAAMHLPRNGLPRPLWNRDFGPGFPEQNLYGSHPFVVVLLPDGTAYCLVMLNSNAMDIVITEDRLSFRMTGGIVDLFIFLGPSPLDVMDQLTARFGRPAVPPKFAFGWHQSKYGYQSVWELQQVVEAYREENIPLEVMWSDIDHMDGRRDFTLDPVNYPLTEMQQFIANLTANKQQWVPIIDPCIKVDPVYPAYNQGIDLDVFIKNPSIVIAQKDEEEESSSNDDDDKHSPPEQQGSSPYYLAQVWPGACHFPDMMHPRGKQFISQQLQLFYDMVPYSGLWIDMNEVSNFCQGDICTLDVDTAGEGVEEGGGIMEESDADDDPPAWVCRLKCSDIYPSKNTTRQEESPYRISNGLQQLPLNIKTVSIWARNLDGSLQRDTHNLYSFAQAQAVYQSLKCIISSDGNRNKKKRPFLLTRSSFLGSGAYAAHWTGDNTASWQDLAQSIPGILNSGLVGMPMAGADICGFQGTTTEELCARWTALGAFYPFARNHADLRSPRQEPYLWPIVAETARKTISMRYKLLPYFYTTAREANTRGAPIARPLWMNFPGDNTTHSNARQFMIGDALLVTPVLQQGVDTVDAYFPPGVWYSVWTDSDHDDDGRKEKSEEEEKEEEERVIIEDSSSNSSTKRRGKVPPLSSSSSLVGVWKTLYAPIGRIPVHVLGGTIIPMYEHSKMTIAETDEPSSPITLVVALPYVDYSGSMKRRYDDHGGGGGDVLVIGNISSSRRRIEVASAQGRMIVDIDDGGEDDDAAVVTLKFEVRVYMTTTGCRAELSVRYLGDNRGDNGVKRWPNISKVRIKGWLSGSVYSKEVMAVGGTKGREVGGEGVRVGGEKKLSVGGGSGSDLEINGIEGEYLAGEEVFVWWETLFVEDGRGVQPVLTQI